MKTVDYYNELKLIQDSEINFMIRCFWDGQWEYFIGDAINGWDDKAMMSTLDGVCNYLIRAVLERYPKSKYVQDANKRNLLDLLKKEKVE